MKAPSDIIRQLMVPIAAAYAFVLFVFPSLYFPGMLYIHALAALIFGYFCVVRRAIRIPILLLLPPVFAVVANVVLGGPGNKHLLFNWLSLYSALFAGYVAFAECTSRQLCLWLISSLGLMTAMIGFEYFGLNWHVILPSFKRSVDGLVTTGLDTVYSETEGVRLRAFCGESSTLAAMLTANALAALFALQRLPRLSVQLRRVLQGGVLALFLGLLVIIQTKSSLAILLAGLAGFTIDSLPTGRDLAKRLLQLAGGVLILGLLLAAGARFVPQAQKEYYQKELQNAYDVVHGPREIPSRTGLRSRLDFMGLMAQVAVDHPFGSGYAGILKAYSAPRLFLPNDEMNTRFPYFVLGLTSFGANLVAQAGPLAAAGFAAGLFLALRRAHNTGSVAPVFTCLGCILAFFWSVEAFYSLLLIPLSVRLCSLPRVPVMEAAPENVTPAASLARAAMGGMSQFEDSAHQLSLPHDRVWRR